jgi:hypothetical protein
MKEPLRVTVQGLETPEDQIRMALEDELDQLYCTLDETERELRSLLRDPDAALWYLSELAKEALDTRQEIRELVRRIRTLYAEPISLEEDRTLQS